MNDNKIYNVLLGVIVLTIITAVVFTALTTYNEQKIVLTANDTVTGEAYSKMVILEVTTEPRDPTEIEALINDITLNNPAEKARYNIHPDDPADVNVCMNMAVAQTVWISDNYHYDTGIVMLWNKYLGDNHAQTWVDINGTRYIIDSTSNYYWDAEDHDRYCGDRYKIQFTSIKKGLELEKENNERLNNKDVH